MTGNEFAGGQRWISELEPELGLGTVFSCDTRRVTLLFQASGEVRHYPNQEAPLRRVRFRPGHTIQSYEGWSLRVEMVEEERGVLIYQGEGRRLPETELSDLSGFRSALDRLLSGPRDNSSWFELRLESLLHRAWWESSPLRGLAGARLPLQAQSLYLAQELADRAAPRVLLSDPMATALMYLAGRVLHRRLTQQRGCQVILLTPRENLDRWARVLLQRFQLPFAMLDETHYRVLAATGEENPFIAESLVIVAIEWLEAEPLQQLHLLSADWDLLVVDQVQRLDWQLQRPGTDYLLVSELCERIPAVLLLAAVSAGQLPLEEEPWLALLEPQTFTGPGQRRAQWEQDRRLVRLAQRLAASETVDHADLLMFELHPGSLADEVSVEQRLDELSKSHSSAHLVFPLQLQSPSLVALTPHVVALPCPEAYAARRTDCYPELHYSGEPSWWSVDPRVEWLIQHLATLEQLVVICEHPRSSQGLYQALARAGMGVIHLHEQQTPLARDRQVERFHDPLGVRPVALVCTLEGIGERLLPTSAHLLWFDLPATPAGLAQRWEALCHSTTAQPPSLYISYLEDTAQADLYHYYRVGSADFQCPPWAYTETSNRLDDWAQAQQREQLARERLGDMATWQCEPPGEGSLIALQELDRDPRLSDYLRRLFRCHGLIEEDISPGIWRLSPGDHSQGSFPGVPDTGTLMTLDRSLALYREGAAFISWDHPLVHEAMGQLLAAERGNACVVAWRDPSGVAELLLEVVYVLECPVEAALWVEAFLPTTPLRLVIDGDFSEVSDDYPQQRIQQGSVSLDESAVNALMNYHRETVEAMLEVAEVSAQMRQHDFLQEIHECATRSLEACIQKLDMHQQSQPGALLAELSAMRERREALPQIFSAVTLRLDALRLVVGQG